MWDLGFRDLSSSVIATRADRLGLGTSVFRDDSGNEIPLISVFECDEGGRRTWTAVFDPDELAAAYDALDERWALGDGAPYAGRIGWMRAMRRAHRTRDWKAWRGLYTDDFTVIDHRPVALGEIHGADDWTDVSRALVEVTPDVSITFPAVLATRRNHWLAEITITGSNIEGGDVVISHYVAIGGFVGDTSSSVENFSLEDLHIARQRLDELDPESSV
jgi:hypothetical protein